MHRKAIPFFTSLILGFSSTPLNGQQAPPIERIVRAWSARQERVRSFRFYWNEERSIPKGQLTDLARGIAAFEESNREMGIEPGTTVPPTDVRTTSLSSLIVDSERFRSVMDVPAWSAKDRAFTSDPEEVVFDGKTAKTFHALGPPYARHPSGTIAPAPRLPRLPFCPVLMTYRALESSFRLFDIGSFTPTGRVSIVDGKPCSELQKQTGDSIARVWLDPSRDYLMLRYRTTQKERTRISVDVRYSKGADTNWIPATWVIDHFRPDGKLLRSSKATVTDYQLNSPAARAEFDLTFPPGTWVIDKSASEPAHYLVREGGRKREIMAGEKGASYEQLLNSDSGQASRNSHSGQASRKPTTKLTGISIGTSLVAIVAAGFLILRWWWRRFQVTP